MAMYDYNELATSIANWTARSDLGELIPDFVRLAEVDIALDLKLQALNKEYPITTDIGQKQYALPADFLSIIRVADSDDVPINQVSPDGGKVELAGYIHLRTNGYYIENGYFVLNVAPLEVETIKFYYIPKALDINTTSTNDILIKYPNIYLYGCLSKAAEYTKDNERMQYWTAKYQASVADANRAQNMKRKAVLTVELR